MPPDPIPAPAPAPAPAPPTVFDPAAAVTQLQQLGYAVYPRGTTLTKEQIEADPVLKPVFGTAIAERFSETYVRLDQDILESTGIAKNPGEKTYDYQKRAAATLKDQIKNAPDVDKVKTEYDKQLSTLREGTRLALGENAIRAAVSVLTLNVPAESVESMREILINQAMLKPFRLDENNRVVFQKYGGDDGKTLIDVVNPADGKSLDVAAYVAEQFKSFIKPPETPAQGANKLPAPANTTSVIPTTEDELGKQLTAEGLRPGQAAFTAEFDKRKAAYMIFK